MEGKPDPRVIQQLMFNRILSHMRLLWVEGVTLVGFDAKTSTVVCSAAGVDVVVSVSLRDTGLEADEG